jgi:hypothetical protein
MAGHRHRTERWIALYAISAVMALASLIIAAFVIPTHVCWLSGSCVMRHRRGDAVAPLVRRLGVAFG